MPDASDPLPATPTPRSRRRRKSSSSKRWLIALGTLAVLLAAAIFSFSVWLDGYLKSDSFRRWISAAISSQLKADASLNGISWRGSSAFVESFSASGSADAPFHSLSAADIRADINAGAIWDRTWHVEGVKVARASINFSKLPDQPTPPPQPPETPASSSGFLSSLIPNRVLLGPVRIDQFGFDWKSDSASASARNIALEIKPSDDQGFVLAKGAGGTLSSSALKNLPLDITDFDASWQEGEIRLDSFHATTADDASITGEASVRLNQNAPVLDARGSLADLQLAKIIPDDWLKRVKGTASASVQISGNPQDPDRLLWRGNAAIKDGLLEGLPILQIIARKTRNEGFVRLVLKDTRTRFTRTSSGDWILEGLLMDAPGLLRLKGNASISASSQLSGNLLLGIVPGTLRYLAGAEQQVFLPIDRANLPASDRALLGPEDSALLWTRLVLGGSLSNPTEDLSDRLALAWFNATVDEVLNMSMEGAIKAADVASKAASTAASKVLENAPAALDKGSDLLQKGAESGAGILQKGAESGIRAIEGLLPR
ncbi:MAG: hypothetical protein DVB22_001000 [Verrucomicrobia bacterium]|nr:MAG: hypothetical protein DVB22_001000 [Verrucomicrobiota bacterium]